MRSPYERLACAVIIQALRDIQAGNEHAQEACHWLQSETVLEWLEILDLGIASAAVQELLIELPCLPRIFVFQPPTGESAAIKRTKIRQRMRERTHSGRVQSNEEEKTTG